MCLKNFTNKWNFEKNLFVFIFFCSLSFHWTDLFSFTNLSHTEGSWIDNNDGYTSFELFKEVPLAKDESLISFLDFKSHFFNHGKIAINSGIALRYRPDENSDQIYGLNAFYDYREAIGNHSFHQVGVGLEYLREEFDFRLNGYIPIGKSYTHAHTTSFHYPGGYFAKAYDIRASYGGFDAEIGSFLRKSEGDKPPFYAAFGYYYYIKTHGFQNDYGFKARLETHFSEYITFEFKGGFDYVYGGMAQGTFYASIPLEKLFKWCQKTSDCTKNNTLYQPIYRQDIIALTQKQCGWIWNWDSPAIPCKSCR